MKPLRSCCLLLGLLALFGKPSMAQWEAHESVLNQGKWLKIGVTSDGVYSLGGATLHAAGVSTGDLDPSRIRLFGNLPSMLPEANEAERFDDLTELAIAVTGADDGSFDEGDSIVFYGRGPLELTLNPLNYYQCQRHYYTDTVYYFLCVDSDVPGLRIQENPPVEANSEVMITTFPDVIYHEHDEISPFASGRAWFGDMMTLQDSPQRFVYDIPELDNTKALRIHSRVVGRSKTRFSYNLRIGNNLVADHQAVAAYTDHEFGKEHENNGMFFSDSDRISVDFEINPVDANPLLYIDYFYLNFWREIVFHVGSLSFRIIPMQATAPTNTIQLQGMHPGLTCWEVTDALHPAVQPFTLEGTAARFGIAGSSERRYHVFEVSGMKPVASCHPIPNQNLHGLTDAEMVIITPSVFRGPSEELAAFHRERDGLACLVVDIAAIYNEFGSGMGDPTAVRDFIRMLYLRSEGRLKYVLLMGKGTHDYRNIKGIGNNFVPTYESEANTCNEVNSMCTDDYFALMDSNEGENCEGRVDIGLGRLPVTTVEQAEQVVYKIKHYADVAATHGIWKGLHFFMSDNDTRTYANNTETLNCILDTACPTMTVQKLYVDSYPLVSTPSGTSCPKAHDALGDFFDQGFEVMSYTGHGGVKSLTSEWVLSLSDILAMDNIDQLPFVHTATCEFSKFDNPNVVSGGELMMVNPRGGAIAMLTTLRPTYGPNNLRLSMSLHEHLYDRMDDGYLRFGDIYRIVKSDFKYYTKSNLVFVLFGDPALRFMHPEWQVRTVKVNGNNAQLDHLLTVSDMMDVEGIITKGQGRIDTLFNGILELRLYDQKSNYVTMGNFDTPVSYSFHNDVLFEGKATVANGRYSIRIPIPSELGYGDGCARLVCYAYDTLRSADALGVYDNLVLVSPDASQPVDAEGPEIQFYFNSPDVVNGDVVPRRGVLYAELYDPHGIYHYNYSIGRDLVLRSNLQKYDNIIVNSYFEPVLDDGCRGRLVFPVEDLQEGLNEFTLKVWDTHNNASEATVSVMVDPSTLIGRAYSFPNPFHEGASFSFVYGDVDEDLTVQIEVFDVMGRRVALLQTQTSSSVGVVPPIYWDGKTDNGQALKAGIYVYRMRITGSDGNVRTVTQRMVRQ